MGIFGFNYNKEGRGVSKNEPEKQGIKLYFDIIVHKFTKLVSLGSLYTLVSLPYLAILFFISGIFVSNMGFSVEEEAMSVLILQFMLTFLIFALWGSGPASAAYAYIMRCYTRGEHTFLWSDGKDKFKENFKQSMVVVIVDVLVLLVGLNAIKFYHWYYAQTGNVLWYIIMLTLILLFAIYTLMHPYLYQFMVTFECKTRMLYKNALIMTIAKLPLNVMTTAVGGGVVVLLFSYINPVVAAIIMTVFGIMFTRYPGEFYAVRSIKRDVLSKMTDENNKNAEEEA